MAIESVFDVARTLQMFFERMGHPPWSIDSINGRWHLVDARKQMMKVDFGPADSPIVPDALDFLESLNFVPSIRRVEVTHGAMEPSEFSVVTRGGIEAEQVAAMITSVLHSTGTLADSYVSDVTGELTPAILDRDKHGIIPVCISGPMDFVPHLLLKERPKFKH